MKKRRSGKRVAWAPGIDKDSVKVQIRHYCNEVKNPRNPDGPNIRDAEWGYIDIVDDDSSGGGGLLGGGTDVAVVEVSVSDSGATKVPGEAGLERHHELFRNAVRQEHAIESKHHALHKTPPGVGTHPPALLI